MSDTSPFSELSGRARLEGLVLPESSVLGELSGRARLESLLNPVPETQEGKPQPTSRINNPQVVSELPETPKSDRLWAYLIEEKPTPTPAPAGFKLPSINQTSSLSELSGKTQLEGLFKPDQSQTSSVLADLSGKTRLESITATTTEAQQPPAPEPEPLFRFLANPEKMAWSRKAAYGEVVTAATSVQAQQYYHTSGRVLKLDDLVLETWGLRRSLRPLLEKLQTLLVPDPQSQTFAPKILGFVWGSQTFKPCVLTDLDWTETAWLGGEPASARLSMTLVEIPPPDSDLVSRITREQKASTDGTAAATTGDNLKTPLTDRQKTEGSKKAQEWLQTNQSKLPKDLQQRVKTKQYLLSTDPKTGNVTLYDPKKTSLGIVGKWDGREFKTDKQTISKATTQQTTQKK